MIHCEWKTRFEQAKVFLGQHDNKSALHLFSKALKACPSSERKSLGRIIFYTGMTLKKLGMDCSALKTWRSGLHIDKHGLSVKMFKRYSNEYGMLKQNSKDEDDYQAFYALQIKTYLGTKKSSSFGTQAEKDMVTDLINEKWFIVKNSHSLSAFSSDQKLSLFCSTRIYFPIIHIPVPVNSVNLL